MDNTPAYGFGIFKYGILEYYFCDSKATDERWTMNDEPKVDARRGQSQCWTIKG